MGCPVIPIHPPTTGFYTFLSETQKTKQPEKKPLVICKVDSLRSSFGLTLASHFLLTFHSLLYFIIINIYIA